MTLDHLALLRAETERFATALERGPLDPPIAACPGWDVGRLGVHLGVIHRWAATAAATGTAPDPDLPILAEPDDAVRHDPAALAAWYRASAGDLVTLLAGLDPDAPTWHPFPVPRRAAVWPRRQLHETLVHRWDAEHAQGRESEIDPVLASDGIDEYFGVMLPRLVVREHIALPASSIHVHCTDTAGEWTARAVDGQVACTREHQKGDAALRGRAADLLLALWGREVAEGALDVRGDPEAAADWLSLGGV